MDAENRPDSVESEWHACDECGKESPDVQEMPCPYELGLYGKKVIVHLCEECAEERSGNV